MLTRKRALDLLQNSWKMGNVEAELQEDRAKFLNKLIRTIYEMVPFQTLSFRILSFILPEERKWPTLYEVFEHCMTGNGGSCAVINSFTAHLLKALGYTAFVCRTLVTSTVFNPHLIVIVKDLEKLGDLHLVDCGLGQPSFRAISLHFHKESPTYQDSYLEYKYIKHDGKIMRMHGKGDLVQHNDPPMENLDFIVGKWRRWYEFKPEMIDLKSLEELGPAFSIRFIRKLQPRAARFPSGKTVMVLEGNLFFLEQEDKTLKKITLESKEEIFKVFEKYFPSIDENVVKQAYVTWKAKL